MAGGGRGGRWSPPSVRIHCEQLDVLWVPVQACGRIVDQGPDIGDKKLLGLLLFHIFEFQFWKFLQRKQDDFMTSQFHAKAKAAAVFKWWSVQRAHLS